MTICYFGLYRSDHFRNKNLILGLRKNGVNVIEIQDRSKGIKKFWRLYQKHQPFKMDYQLMMAGFPGQLVMPLAKLISRRLIVLDLHASLYDAMVVERKTVEKNSIKAFIYYFLDWLACSLADKVLAESQAQIDYFSGLLKIKKEKFLKVPLGVDDDLYRALPRQNDTSNNFIIGFYGFLQKVDGLDTVIKAMKKLAAENVEFWIIGAGPEYFKIKRLAQDELQLKNVKFHPVMPVYELLKKIREFDLGLGQFALSQKVETTLAPRVSELMAMKIPVLTAESKAAQEFFKPDEHIFYTLPGDVDAAVKKILEIKKDEELRNRVAGNGYQRVKDNLTVKIIGESLLKEFNRPESPNSSE